MCSSSDRASNLLSHSDNSRNSHDTNHSSGSNALFDGALSFRNFYNDTSSNERRSENRIWNDMSQNSSSLDMSHNVLHASAADSSRYLTSSILEHRRSRNDISNRPSAESESNQNFTNRSSDYHEEIQSAGNIDINSEYYVENAELKDDEKSKKLDWLAIINSERTLGETSNAMITEKSKTLVDYFQNSLEENTSITDKLKRLKIIIDKIQKSSKSHINVSPDRTFKIITSKYADHNEIVDQLRVIVTVDELRITRTHPILINPCLALPALEENISHIWKQMYEYENSVPVAPRIGITGWLGRNNVTPRQLGATYLNRLVCVTGIINSCGLVSTKLSKAVYIKEKIPKSSTNISMNNLINENPLIRDEYKNSVHIRNFYDITHFDRDKRDTQPPTSSDAQGKFYHKQEIGLSLYKNCQKFTVQELPEETPTGHMPRYVDVLVDNDLCDSFKCGDSVKVYGIYRPRAYPLNTSYHGNVSPIIVANNVDVNISRNKKQLFNSTESEVQYTNEDIHNFQVLSKQNNIFEIFSNSIAPSISGHEIIKKGLLLMLIGGTEKQNFNGHHIRGDIHVLLIGDPACGKSQLLRYVLNLIPRSVSATGRGSSGVGLTAAIATDPDTGEKRIESGACVMADKSVICIDEFDKMQHNDRVAIHEVLEQQTVTIAKASMHTTLHARCTVFAAANPIYGCWSNTCTAKQQINFENSLLSRFDMIFLVKDSNNEIDDNRIAGIVLYNLCNVHQNSDQVHYANYKKRNNKGKKIKKYQDTNFVSDLKCSKDGTTDPVETHFNSSNQQDSIMLSSQFIRKYIEYAKKDFYENKSMQNGWKNEPEITAKAAKYISDYYWELREKFKRNQNTMIQTVTPRTLEAIIRIATAHARLRLKQYVEIEDIEIASTLLNYSLFGEIDLKDEDSISQQSIDSDNDSSGAGIVENIYEASTELAIMDHAEDYAAQNENQKDAQKDARKENENNARNDDTAMLLRPLILDAIRDEYSDNGVNISKLYNSVINNVKNIAQSTNNNINAKKKEIFKIAAEYTFNQFSKIIHNISQSESAPLMLFDDQVFEC